MNRTARILILMGLITGMFIAGFSCNDLTSGKLDYKGERIGLIHIEGIITGSHARPDPFLMASGTSSETVIKQLDEATKDKNVKAVVIRVNSPGGSAAASQEIFDAIKRFRERTNRKVYISMGDVAASGGYYVAAPADVIYADPATLTGSIGVIMNLINYEGLFEKIGLDEITLKSGEYKDIGSPIRTMTPAEKRILENILDDVHEQFKEAIMDGRGMSGDEIEKVATGEIWTGNQAKSIGLVDELGGLKDTLDRAAADSGLNVEDYVVSPLGEGSIFDQLFRGLQMGINPVIHINDPSPIPTGLFFNPLLHKLIMM